MSSRCLLFPVFHKNNYQSDDSLLCILQQIHTNVLRFVIIRSTLISRLLLWPASLYSKMLYTDALISASLSSTLIPSLGTESVILHSAIALHACIDNSYCQLYCYIFNGFIIRPSVPRGRQNERHSLVSSCSFVTFPHLDPNKKNGHSYYFVQLLQILHWVFRSVSNKA